MDAVIYVHGKGGSASECERYKPLFPGYEVTGPDYRSAVPWEAGKEIHTAVRELKARADGVVLVANSIGAFFCLHADLSGLIRRAYFISPLVDMERMIADMMRWANVTETELRKKGTISTDFGETLSWEYLDFVRRRPIEWSVPTQILYAGGDELIPAETVRAFAEKHHAGLTVMEGGEHWFHTEEQLRFLDGWIRRNEERYG
ncbi:MAG: alpha/beta hydrolase [Clostridia bacterium]|nr:alpha/beta hydrolase [Clostridia bacterium]